MIRGAIAKARAFENWHDDQTALKCAIAPLTVAQWQQRLMSGLRTPGELAEHIVFGRALHLHRTLFVQTIWGLLYHDVPHAGNCRYSWAQPACPA